MSSRRHLPSPQLSQLAHVGKGFNRLSRRSPSHCRSVHRLKCNSPGRREFDLCRRPSPRVHSMQAVDFCSHPKRRKLPGRNSSYCLPDWDWWRPSNPCPRMASRCLAEVPNQSLLEVIGRLDLPMWFASVLSGPFSLRWADAIGRGSGRVLVALSRPYAALAGESLRMLDPQVIARLRILGVFPSPGTTYCAAPRDCAV